MTPSAEDLSTWRLSPPPANFGRAVFDLRHHKRTGTALASTPGMIVLETARLVLRHLVLDDEDAAFIHALVNDPDFLHFIGERGVRTLDDARRYITEGPQASHTRHGFGLCAVVHRELQQPIGICGLLRRNTLPHPDLGFAFLAAHRGQGYGYEAAAAMLIHARDVLGLRSILAITAPDNEVSGRLLEKLGFRFERIVGLDASGGESRLYALVVDDGVG